MTEVLPKTAAAGQAPNEQTQQQPPDVPVSDVTDEITKEQIQEGPKSGDPSAESGALAAGQDSELKRQSMVEAPPPSEKQREGDSLSIKPSDPPPPPAAAPAGNGPESPVCSITLLLPTGARHPYKIDERYLAKRNVDIPDVTETGAKDPFSISIYKLKELILREWREEWESKPASPSSIRLIHFGKLLDDKEQLKRYHFSVDSPNVVHMSVRPAEMMEEEEAAKGKASSTRDGRRRRTREESGGCCVIL